MKKLFLILMILLVIAPTIVIGETQSDTIFHTAKVGQNQNFLDIWNIDYMGARYGKARTFEATDTMFSPTGWFINAGAQVATVSSGAVIGSVSIPDVFTSMQEPTGFENRTSSIISFATPTTPTFTITGTHVIYIKGVKYTKTTASLALSPTNTGMYFYYYNASGTLTVSQTFPGFYVPLIASVYYNATSGSYILGDERHGVTMDGATHDVWHSTIGCRYESGLVGTFADSTFSITAGGMYDEDIYHTINAQTKNDVLYTNGSSAWVTDVSVATYYKKSGSNLQYNNPVTGTLTSVSSNSYMAVWVFATNNPNSPIMTVIGQRQDNNLIDARANNTYESLVLGTLPSKEMKLLYRVILRNDATPYEEVQDYRTSPVNGISGSSGAIAHNTLTGKEWSVSGHNDANFGVSGGVMYATQGNITKTYSPYIQSGVQNVTIELSSPKTTVTAANAQNALVTGTASIGTLSAPIITGVSSTGASASYTAKGGVFNGDFNNFPEGNLTTYVYTRDWYSVFLDGLVSSSNGVIKMQITNTNGLAWIWQGAGTDFDNASYRSLPIKPNQAYRLSVRANCKTTNNASLSVVLLINGSSDNYLESQGFSCGKDGTWKTYSTTFTSHASAAKYSIAIHLAGWGAASTTGDEAYFDDIKLEEVESLTNNSPLTEMANIIVTGVSSEFVDQQQTLQDGSLIIGKYSDGTTYRARQSFVPTKPSVSAYSIYLNAYQGNPIGNIIVQLKTPAGAVVASEDIINTVAKSISGGWSTRQLFGLINPGSTYYFEFYDDAIETTNNYFRIAVYNGANVGNYSGGNAASSTNGGTNWSEYTYDFEFKTHYSQNTNNVVISSNDNTPTKLSFGDTGLPEGATIDLERGKFNWTGLSGYGINTFSELQIFFGTVCNSAPGGFSTLNASNDFISLNGVLCRYGEIQKDLVLLSGYIINKINTFGIIKNCTIAIGTSTNSGGTVDVSADGFAWTTLTSVTQNPGSNYIISSVVRNLSTFYIRWKNNGGYSTIEKCTIEADIDTSSITRPLLSPGSNTIRIANNGGSYTSRVSIWCASSGLVDDNSAIKNSIQSIQNSAQDQRDRLTSTNGLTPIVASVSGTLSIDSGIVKDATGNIGIGTTDIENWMTGYKSIEFPYAGIMYGLSNGAGIHFAQNAYYENSTWKRKGTNAALNYAQIAGAHYFRHGVADVTDSSITWVPDLTIDLNGNVIIGSATASPVAKLTVNGGSAYASGGWISPSISDMKVNIAPMIDATSEKMINALRTLDIYEFNWKPKPEPKISDCTDSVVIVDVIKSITVKRESRIPVYAMDANDFSDLGVQEDYTPATSAPMTKPSKKNKNVIDLRVPEEIIVKDVTESILTKESKIVKTKEKIFQEQHSEWQSDTKRNLDHKVNGIMVDKQMDNDLIKRFMSKDKDDNPVGIIEGEAIGTIFLLLKEQQKMIDGLNIRIKELEK